MKLKYTHLHAVCSYINQLDVIASSVNLALSHVEKPELCYSGNKLNMELSLLPARLGHTKVYLNTHFLKGSTKLQLLADVDFKNVKIY